MDIIREDFFHFLWENLHFSQAGLKTTTGDSIQIIHPGFNNTGDGPDYRIARIRLNGVLFYGDIELHKKASDWIKHRHQYDSRYEQVILHVVIHDDLYKRNVRGSDGYRIPTLELNSSLPSSLARLWRAWHRPVELPCSGIIKEIPDPVLQDIMNDWDRNFFQHRLDRMVSLFPVAKPITQAWKEMLIRGIFQGLGYHKNKEPMLKLADLLCNKEQKVKKVKPDPATNKPVSVLHKADFANTREPVLIKQLEHYLLQKAGFETEKDAILKRKDWDFSTSRPANQPETRVRQAAELYIRINRITIKDWLRRPVETIWKDSCRLKHAPALGRNRRIVIFQNVVVPAIYLLGKWTRYNRLCEQAGRHWAGQRIPLPRKTEKIFKESGLPSGIHYNKLATLHHYKYYCKQRKCHKCAVMRHLAQT